MAKAKKKRDQNEKRRLEQAAAGAPVLGEQTGKAERNGRLPDRSEFTGLVYDAKREMWTGDLIVQVKVAREEAAFFGVDFMDQ